MNQILSFVLAWYNLPFTFLILLGLLLVALQLVGLGGGDDSDHDLDHDVDLSHDVDLHHDVDLGHDFDHDADLSHDLDHDLDHDLSHDVDHDADADHSVEHEAGAGGPSGMALLAYLGVGKAPLMVVLLILFDAIGLLGWLLNGLAASLFGRYVGIVFAGVFPLALIAGGMMTSRLARLFGQLLPPISTTATRAQAFVGQRGTVISPFVDETYGMVHLRDAGGTLITVFAVAHPSVDDPIRRGEEVLLLSYDPDQKRYLVAHANPVLPGQTRS